MHVIPPLKKAMDMESLKALWNIVIYAFTRVEFYGCVMGSILIFALILYVVRMLITILNSLKGN